MCISSTRRCGCKSATLPAGLSRPRVRDAAACFGDRARRRQADGPSRCKPRKRHPTSVATDSKLASVAFSTYSVCAQTGHGCSQSRSRFSHLSTHETRLIALGVLSIWDRGALADDACAGMPALPNVIALSKCQTLVNRSNAQRPSLGPPPHTRRAPDLVVCAIPGWCPRADLGHLRRAPDLRAEASSARQISGPRHLPRARSQGLGIFHAPDLCACATCARPVSERAGGRRWWVHCWPQ